MAEAVKAPRNLFRAGNKIYDLGTRNTSFISVAYTLKKLGRKNWFFMLELNDPTLAGVDPHAVDAEGITALTPDQITRITIEIARNPWYYLREVARIPDPGGSPVPYKANRGNIAQAWCTIKGISSWLNIPRQQGKTMSMLALLGWAYGYGTRNSDAIFLNKSRGDSDKNLSRMTAMLEKNPRYLNIKQYIDEDGKIIKGVDNATMIRHPITENTVSTKGKANSKEMALSIARGLTTPVQYSDETEFTAFIDVIIRNSVPTYSTAAARAKANKAFHARIFTSTPGDLDTKAGIAAEQLLSKTQKFTEEMYDWSDEEIEAYANAPGYNGIVYIEFSWKQLGLSREWLRSQSDQIGDPVTVRRELLLQRIHGSSDSPYDQEDLQYISECGKAPIDGGEIILLGLFKVVMYAQIDKRVPYIVSVDCATGTLGDNDAFTIINPYTPTTPEPIGEFESGYISETQFAALLIELVKEHIPRAVLCIERNHVGSAIISILMNSEISGNIYFDKEKDIAASEIKDEENIESMLKKQAALKKYYGIYTQGSSRADMYRILDRHVHEYKEHFVTANVIRDLQRLVKSSSGKVQAGPGFHDDSIMSYLIGMYVYYHGNNLAAFGIEKGSMEIENQNEGIYIPDINVLSEILPDAEIEKIIKGERSEEEDYQRSVQEAIQNARRDAEAMRKLGMIKQDGLPSAELLNGNPEIIQRIQSSMTYEDYHSGSNLDLFDALNDF